MPILRVDRGYAASWVVTLRGDDGAALVNTYDGTEPLDLAVTDSGGAPVTLADSSVAWRSPAAGTLTLAVGDADTAALAAGRYRLAVGLTDAGERYEAFAATLDLTDPAAPITSVTQGNAPARLATVYATDEQIAVAAPVDYMALVPQSGTLAYGADGAFAAGSPWVLTSATVDFEAVGVLPGHVVALTKPKANFPLPALGVLFAVDSVLANTLTLRRPGLRLGEGQPPAPAAGLTGVEFKVATFGPQIDEVTFDINDEYEIDPAVPGATPDDLYSKRDLEQATVLAVLQRAYAANMETSTGDYAKKFDLYTARLVALTARKSVRWGTRGDDRPPTGDVFGRLRRG